MNQHQAAQWIPLQEPLTQSDTWVEIEIDLTDSSRISNLLKDSNIGGYRTMVGSTLVRCFPTRKGKGRGPSVRLNEGTNEYIVKGGNDSIASLALNRGPSMPKI